MDKIEFHTTFNTQLNQASGLVISQTEIEMDRNANIESALSGLDIEFDIIQQTKIHIQIPSLPMRVFAQVDNFLSIQSFKNETEIFIHNDGKPISFINGVTYVDSNENSTDFLFKNTLAYRDFLEFLKTQETDLDGTMHFIDSYSRDLRKIVMVSLSDKGRITLSYDIEVPLFDRQFDYSMPVQKFKDCFIEPSKNLAKFLKAAIINFVADKPNSERVKVMFENLDNIIAKAKMNFEVYLNNLSIDKIKKDYDEIKSKFFKDLSDVLTKLTQQIIALPIGLCAALLAVDKITENTFYLYFIASALVLTSVYLSLLLRVQYKDLNHLKRMFLLDYDSLLGNKFFVTYPDEKIEFEGIKMRFLERVNFLKSVSEAYFWILNVSNLAIICFIIQKLSSNSAATFYVATALAFVLALFRNYVRSEDDKAK